MTLKRPMRLFKRGKYWHVEFRRGLARSLKTTDEKEALATFRELKREWLRGRLLHLDPGKTMTLGDYMAEYLLERRGAVSRSTHRMDDLALRLLADVVGRGTLLRSITKKKVEEFKVACRARKCRPESVNAYLRHIKVAMNTALEQGYLRVKPRIKMCPTGKRLPRVLRPEQVQFLLMVAQEYREELWRHIMFSLWTGSRRSENLSLKWQNITWGTKPRAIVRGKGDKERVVPLVPAVLNSLRPYRQDIGAVFPHRNPSTISHWFLALARDCEINARFHDLRHTSATYMLAKGIDIRFVQKILGHAQLQTTTIYTHVIGDTLYDEMEKLNFD